MLACLILSAFSYALDYGEEKQYERPKRQVSVIISKEGYYPATITVFKDEEVHFFVTNTTRDQSCLILREKDLFISSMIGKISEGEAIFDKAGEYKIYCPTGNISGSLVVLERPSEIRKREIASEKKVPKVRYWLPREE